MPTPDNPDQASGDGELPHGRRGVALTAENGPNAARDAGSPAECEGNASIQTTTCIREGVRNIISRYFMFL